MDELRSQMAVLKEKLDNQDIVNDRLMRDSLKQRMSWVKKYVWGEIIALPFIILLWYFLKMEFHLSWWSFSALSLLLIVSVTADYYINNHALKDVDYQRNNLLQTARKLVRMKKQRTWQSFFGVCAAFSIIIWMGFEVYWNTPHTPNNDQILLSLVIGGIIGFVIGVVIGLVILSKMQRTNNKLIRQIKELMGE